MARGDDNILFNPPRIKKARKSPVRDFLQEEVRSLPGENQGMFLLGTNIFCRTNDGVLHLFDQDIQTRQDFWEELYNVPNNTDVFSSSKALAWADSSGIVIKNFFGGERMVLKELPPGCNGREEILGGYIANDKLYLLSGDRDKLHLLPKDRENGYLTLQSTSLLDDSGWDLVSDLSNRHYARIADKGQTSLLFHSEYPGRAPDDISWDIGTISILNQIGWNGEAFGVGRELEEVIKSSVERGGQEAWGDLLTPSDNPSNIWYVKGSEPGTTSLIPGISSTPPKETLLVERSMMKNQDERVLTIKNSDKVVKLERFGNQFVLLGDKSLSLITPLENGGVAEWIHQLKKEYSEILFNGYQIILYNKGEDDCLSLQIR